MSKAITSATVRMLVPAGKATPTPPVGPALGQKGVKAIDFCKAFNERTAHLVPGVPVTAVVSVMPDRSYSFITKSPPTAWLLKQAAGIEKGSHSPRITIVGSISLKHIYEIACIKQDDPGFAGVSLRNICRRIIGTAAGMGIDVVP